MSEVLRFLWVCLVPDEYAYGMDPVVLVQWFLSMVKGALKL